MMMRWTLCAGIAAALPGPATSSVTSSHARTWTPAASISARIASPVRDAVGEPETRREGSAGAHVRLGEVHDGDAASELAGQRAGRPAQPTAHIEHAGAGLEAGQPRQSLGRALAAPVELVGG